MNDHYDTHSGNEGRTGNSSGPAGTKPVRHVHSDEEKKAVVNRLAKAAGHLDKVRRMVEQDVDCSDVLVQLAAVRNAINNTGKLILKNHLEHCIVHAIEEDDMEEIYSFNRAIELFIR